MSAYINPFFSEHVDILWTHLLAEFGRDAVYYCVSGPSSDVKVIWLEGVEEEEMTPGRYSHALVRNASLPAPPALGDVMEREGSVFDVVRVNAYAYYYSRLILQERG